MINPFNHGTQVHRLMERLLQGPATSTELMYDLGIQNYTGRLSDLRKKGIVLATKEIRRNLWEYSIVRPVVAGQQSFLPMEGGTNAH
jgi:hypothetical protein